MLLLVARDSAKLVLTVTDIENNEIHTEEISDLFEPAFKVTGK